jgi:Lon protease-like protein
VYTIPLFPLDTVLFPGIPIHLHIFEPRYRLMMRTCIAENQPFGVVMIRRGEEAGGPVAEPAWVGCSARITEVDRLPDGRMNLTALGDERFRILRLKTDLPYLVGEVEGFPLDHPHSLDIIRGLRRLVPYIRLYLRQVDALDGEKTMDLSKLELPDDPMVLIHLAAALLQVPPAEKQPLLEAEAAPDLLAGVARLYRRETALMRQALQNQASEQAHQQTPWLN